MAFFKHSKVVLVLLLSALTVYIGLLNLLDRMEWKTPSDGVSWIQTDRGVEVKSTKIAPPTTGSPLEKGDRLVSVGGIPIRNLDEYIEIMELLAGTSPPASEVTYWVEKADSGARISYSLGIRLRSNVDVTDFLLGLVAFAYLGIGVFIFLSNWKAQGAFHFYLICLVAFSLFLYRYSGRADAFDVFIYWFSAVALLLLPPLFLHFCCYFPKPLSLFRSAPSLNWLFYLPAIFLGGLHALWFSGSLQPFGLPRVEPLGHLFDRIHLAHFITLFLLGTAALAYTRRETSSSIHRLQMRWVTWGTLIGILPFACFYALPFLLGLGISPYMEVSLLGLILVPLSFGYAITHHRLTDVKLIFREGAAYVVASSALLGLYVGIVLLIGRAIQDFSPESGFVLFALAALLVAFLFAPFKNRIQAQIDRYFYQEEYDYRRSLADFGQTLSSEIKLSSLTERIADRIRKTLNVIPVALFLREDSQTDEYHLYHAQDLPESEERLSVLEVPEEIFGDFDRELNPLFLLSSHQQVDGIRECLAGYHLHYVQPLRVHNRIIGFWALGKRFNGEFLSSADLDLMATLSGYAAIAIDNALLYQSLEGKTSELAQLKAYSENVVKSITVGVLAMSPEGEITVWNTAMEAICGLERVAVVGKNISGVFSPDLVRTLRSVVEGPRWDVAQTSRLYKTYIQMPDGQGRLVNITLAPFVSQDDVVAGTLLVFDDITEKVQLENQLLQAEKLSSIGLLAAGIAHEINTPLTGVCSYTQMLLKETPPEDLRYKVLKKIEKQSFRASSIVDSLLNLARVRDSDFQEVDVNGLMLETLSLLDHQFRKTSIDVKLDLDPVLPSTVANGGKLQQVFMNLFLNAKDAMPEGGQLRVGTHCEDSQLVVKIEDTGMGISDENLKRIYDPFFTTKEVGKGTGLGLSVCYGIIQEHSGRISVKSRPGLGSAFRLQLPLKRVH
jgi:PAS domain S-box-containing protein